MKRRFTLVFLLLSAFIYGQEVSTFTSITANGGVTVDSNGNVYIAHFGPLPPNPAIGRNIYKISPDGTPTLFVENVLSVGSGNQYHSAGFLYQSNFASNDITKIAADGSVVERSFAQVAGPVGIAEGDDGNLYVCSCNSASIRRVALDGSASLFATAPSFNCPNGITKGDDGNFYVTNFSDGRITKVNPGDGSTELIGSTPAGNGHIAFRSRDQHLYIASYSGQQIFKMDLDGNSTLIAGTGALGSQNSMDPLLATFSKPNGIEWSPDGCELYISQDEGVVRVMSFTDAGCSSGFGRPLAEGKISIYPNPTDQQLHFELPTWIQIDSIYFLNSLGKQVASFSFKKTIDVSHLSAGLYTIIMKSTKGESFSGNVAIQKQK